MYVYTHVRRAHARGVLKNPVQGAHPRETRMIAYMRFRPLRLFLYVGIHNGMFCRLFFLVSTGFGKSAENICLQL